MRLFHISDLHIRSGDAVRCRYDEYNYVFQKFVAFVRDERVVGGGDSVVITGDIFHHKSKLESPGIKLFYDFLKALASLVPVYVIRGNHDYKQWEVSEVDLITSMLIPGISNVTYFNETGVYRISDELGFGVLAIQDSNASFPLAGKLKDVKHKVALFHGVVTDGAKFKGYDCALLGDIHTQVVYGCAGDGAFVDNVQVGSDYKIMNKWDWSRSGTGIPFGYASSMVRQSVGESIEGHGFLMWDLGEKTVVALHIHNVVDIAAAECEERLFERPAPVAQEKRDYDCDCDCDDGGGGEKSVKPVAALYNTPEQWITYLAEHGGIPGAGAVIRSPDMLVIGNVGVELGNEVIAQKVADRNAKIKKRLDAYLVSGSGSGLAGDTKNTFRMLKMTWNWLLCYGADNEFFFNKLEGKIVTISGRNGHGKTSFLEIILLALYGTGFPSRSNRLHSGSVVSIQKPRSEPCQVQLTLQVETVGMVRVFRTFYGAEDKKPTASAVAVGTKIELWNPDLAAWDSLVSGKVAVDKWIEAHVGSMDAFLLSCMVSQNADADFFAMTAAEQKEMLDNALSIDTHTRYMELLKESRLAHQCIGDLMEAALAGVARRILDEVVVAKIKHKMNALAVDIGATVALECTFMGELFPRAHYEKVAATGSQSVSASDLQFELENIKRSKSARMTLSGGKAVSFEKPCAFYEKQFEEHIKYGETFGFASSGSVSGSGIYNKQEYKAAKERVDSVVLEEECGFDKGPYNTDCKCCLQRLKNFEVREAIDVFKPLWFLRKRYLEDAVAVSKGSRVDELTLALAQASARDKARSVLDSYEDIVKARNLTSLVVEKEKLNAELEAHVKAVSEHKVYSEKLGQVVEKIKVICNVQGCLEGYITWLYTDKVIPLVEKYTNQIMNLIDPSLHLKGWMLEGGKGFDWSIYQTGVGGVFSESFPPIEKASGFQRFICGLAVRIALGNIGASCIKPRQLFLDEGFTSCDSVNLARVPDFLVVLLQLYDSIVLVTHLEELKDCCESVAIRRHTDGTSQIK